MSVRGAACLTIRLVCYTCHCNADGTRPAGCSNWASTDTHSRVDTVHTLLTECTERS